MPLEVVGDSMTVRSQWYEKQNLSKGVLNFLLYPGTFNFCTLADNTEDSEYVDAFQSHKGLLFLIQHKSRSRQCSFISGLQ